MRTRHCQLIGISRGLLTAFSLQQIPKSHIFAEKASQTKRYETKLQIFQRLAVIRQHLVTLTPRTKACSLHGEQWVSCPGIQIFSDLIPYKYNFCQKENLQNLNINSAPIPLKEKKCPLLRRRRHKHSDILVDNFCKT